MPREVHDTNGAELVDYDEREGDLLLIVPVFFLSLTVAGSVVFGIGRFVGAW